MEYITVRAKNIIKDSIFLEFIYSSFGQGLFLLLGLVQNKLFATFFEINVFGEWNLLVSIYLLISMLPFTALDQGNNRYALYYLNSGQEDVFISSIMRFYGRFFIGYICLILIFSFFLESSFFATYKVEFVFYFTSEIVVNSLITIENAYRKRKEVFLVRFCILIFRMVGLIFLYKLGIFTIKYVLYLFSGTNILIMWTLQRKYLKLIFKTNHFKVCQRNDVIHKIFRYAYPLIIWSIFGWMQNMISRWYLNNFLNLANVAQYSILTSLSFYIPNAIYTLAAGFILPYLYSLTITLTRRHYYLLIGFFGAILLLYCIFVFLHSDFLITVIADKKFLPISKYLKYTTITSSISVFAMFTTIKIYKDGNTKSLILPNVLPGLFVLVFGYIIINKHGFLGAVSIYSLSQILYSLLVIPVSIKAITKIPIVDQN